MLALYTNPNGETDVEEFYADDEFLNAQDREHDDYIAWLDAEEFYPLPETWDEYWADTPHYGEPW